MLENIIRLIKELIESRFYGERIIKFEVGKKSFVKKHKA